MRFAASSVIAAVVVAAIASSAAAAPPTCKPDALEYFRMDGTIRFVRSTVKPIMQPDGTADYSIVSTTDEYELTLDRETCGLKKVLVRFVYGHVRSIACADNVRATVKGFLRRDADDSALFLSVMSSSDIECKAR